MKNKQLSKSWKALLSIVLSIALVLGLMPSLQNARNFAGADESATDETEQIVADENTQGGESIEQAGEQSEQAEQQSEEAGTNPSEEQAGKGGETTDPTVDPTAEKETSTDTAANSDANLNNSEENGAVTKAVKALVKVSSKIVKQSISNAKEYHDQSAAQTLSGDVYIDESNDNMAPIIVGEGGLNLIIKDGVTVTIDGSKWGSGNYSAIRCEGGGLTITAGVDESSSEDPKGTGVLNLQGGPKCAGIGGNDSSGTRHSTNNITILACTVNATGGKSNDGENYSGAGIGGGYKGHLENFTMYGGNVTATGPSFAAGVGNGGEGGGEDEQAKDIYIHGGTLIANGGCQAAGIGGGYKTGAHTIEIAQDMYMESGELIPTKVQATGGQKAAGIGGGDGSIGTDPHGHNITINGGEVIATGRGGGDGTGGAGIGSGNGQKAYDLKINGGKVTAVGNGGGAGIGGGSEGACYNIYITGGVIDAKSEGSGGAGIGAGNKKGVDGDSNKTGIDISGGIITATANDYGAGIGSGYKGNAKNISISSSAGISTEITATGGSKGGSGIGAGDEGEAEIIKISGGYIKATAPGRGGGIGSGSGKKCKDVTITDGYIEAKGGPTDTGCGIGTGKMDKKSKNEEITVSGSLKILGDSFWPPTTVRPNSGDDLSETEAIQHYMIIDNGVDPEVKVGSPQGTATYGSECSVSQLITTVYVSGCNFTLKWYEDAEGTKECNAPDGVSTSFDKYLLSINNSKNSPAGIYYFRVSAGDVKSDVATYSINKANATITSGSATKIFDGTPLTCEEFTTDGFLDGDSVECYNWKSIKSAAESPAQNTFEFKAAGDTNLDNYEPQCVYGTLTILPDTEYFFIQGENYNGKYDGNPHSFSPVKIVGKNGVDITSLGTITYYTGTEGSWTKYEAEGTPSVKDVADSTNVKAEVTMSVGGESKTKSAVYSMTVTPRNVTLTSGSADKEYDGQALTNTNVEEAGDGFVDSESYTATPKETSTITKAGSVKNDFDYTLTGESAKEANYNITKVLGTLTVNKKSAPITITTASKTWKYDGQVHSACTEDDWSYTGDKVEGETLDVNFTHTDTKEKVVVVGAYSNSLSNEIDPETGEITKKAYSMTDNDGEDVTYCYTFADVCCGTLTINPIYITLTSESDWKVYDGQPLKKESASQSGEEMVETDTIKYEKFASVTEAGVLTDNTFTCAPADEASTFNANNYNITYVYGKLLVIKELALMASNQEFLYDGESHQAAATLVTPAEVTGGEVQYKTSEDGKTWPEQWGTGVPSLTDAGKLYIKAQGLLDGEVVTDEYQYTATVNPRAIKIATDSATKPYDGTALKADQEGNVHTYGDGFVGEDKIEITINGTQTDVGFSENTCTWEFTGSSEDNYSFLKEFGTLTVTKNANPIVITTKSDEQIYDGSTLQNADWSATWGGTDVEDGKLCEDDVLSVTPYGAITEVGSTPNICTYQVLRNGVDVTSFYTFDEVNNGTLEVTARNIVVNVGSASKVYDSTALTCDKKEITGDGFIDGDAIAVTISGSQTKAGTSNNNATYAISPSASAAHYKVTVNPGKLTVEKRKVSVTSGSAASTWTACPDEGLSNTKQCTVTVNTFVSGEVEANCPKGETVLEKPGTQPDPQDPAKASNEIDYGWIGNGNPANYEITENLGKLVITNDQDVSFAVSNYEGTYDGQPHTGSVSHPENVTIEYSENESDWQPDPFEYTDAVEKTVYVRGTKGTSQAFATFTVKINKRPITLTAGSATKVYDDTALECEDIIIGGDGFATRKDKTVSERPPADVLKTSGSITDVGSAKNEVIGWDSEYEATGYNPDNYIVTDVDGKLTISKRPVVLLSKSLGFTAEELIAMGVEKSLAEAMASGHKSYNGSSYTQQDYFEVGNTTSEHPGLKHIDNMGFVSGQGVTCKNWATATDAGAYKNSFEYDVKSGTDLDKNYNLKCLYGLIKISPVDVEITSDSAEAVYKKEDMPLTKESFSVTSGAFVGSEQDGVACTYTGSQAEVGESANTFTYTLDSTKIKDINYNITAKEGTLKVTTSDKLILKVPESKTYTYDGKPHGEKAKATIDDDPYEGYIWYSVDGGKTYNSTYPMIVGAGTINVKAYVEEYGYTRSEGEYSITVVNPTAPSEEDNPVVDVNQEDLNNAAETYVETLIEKYKDDPDKREELTGCGKCAWIEAEAKATEDPDDMAKLQQAAPGKNFKYADVRLYCSAWDEDGNFIDVENESGETITLDRVDIGDRNQIPIRITYTSDMTNTQDVECLRVHNGEVNSLPQGAEAAVAGEYWQMGEDQQSVMIAASKYSTYAAAYNVADDGSNATGTGATGDNMNLAICLLGLLMSCCAAYALVYIRRRKDN